MAQAHHLHLYASHEVGVHPGGLADFTSHLVAFGMGALFAAVAVITLESAVVTGASRGSTAHQWVVALPPVGAQSAAEAYLPSAFAEQATNARIEEFPAQF